jgi:hypothetical protein
MSERGDLETHEQARVKAPQCFPRYHLRVLMIRIPESVLWENPRVHFRHAELAISSPHRSLE